ncbi:MAG: hypothetical protein KGK17_10120 [Betaproteobacteria bacterium]|nr:hypothetical protein [Betaproteobacteria bacterium]
MIKLLLWGIAIWLAFKYALPALRRLNGTQNPQSPRDKGAQDTVRCAHCGVYVLRSEAVTDGSVYYCSDGHRQAGRS